MTNLRVLSLLLLAGVVGCGTSGSNPVERPEVFIQVIPQGPTRFKVLSLVTGGVTHPSIEGKEFVANGRFSFFVENADPPYAAAFERTGDGELEVRLSIVATTGKIDLIQDVFTSSASAQAAVTTGDVPTRLPNPEVRIDVCAPIPGATACFTDSDSGAFGIPIAGTVGDSFTTHLVGLAPAPCIYFLDGARDSINAVVNAVPSGQLILGQLFLNGALRVTKASSGDVVIKEDL